MVQTASFLNKRFRNARKKKKSSIPKIREKYLLLFRPSLNLFRYACFFTAAYFMNFFLAWRGTVLRLAGSVTREIKEMPRD